MKNRKSETKKNTEEIQTIKKLEIKTTNQKKKKSYLTKKLEISNLKKMILKNFEL